MTVYNPIVFWACIVAVTISVCYEVVYNQTDLIPGSPNYIEWQRFCYSECTFHQHGNESECMDICKVKEVKG